MGVVERVGNSERVRGYELDPATAVARADRMRDSNRPLTSALRRAPGCQHELHERFGAPVRRRQFRAVHTDLEVVDAEASRRRHEVLDGLDPNAVATDRRRVMGVDDALGRGGNWLGVLTDAEDDAGVGRPGRKYYPDHPSRVEPNTFQADRLADGVLSHDRGGTRATRVPDLHFLLNG